MLKAVLIDCIPPSLSKEEASYRMLEADSLIKTFGGITLVKKIQKKLIPNYKTYIGAGKIEEIISDAKKLDANILIVNNELKPRQNFNISEKVRSCGLEVWDRVDLILKIFQRHAETREAKLEIELASIKHMGPRIFRMGMELSRQAGGIGTRGVGETNIEFMKRHLDKMEDRIKAQLQECKRVRKLHRDRRKRLSLSTVGIIGYTNAGKTSLLNALTGKGAYTANKLFATLDTRVGKIFLEEAGTPGRGREILISDTIGFIQNLPPQLVKSFNSTLEETVEADLLLHVIDISDPRVLNKIATVNEILAQMQVLTKPTIYVFNKTDLKPASPRSHLVKKYKACEPCFVSSVTGKGIKDLKKKILQTLRQA